MSRRVTAQERPAPLRDSSATRARIMSEATRLFQEVGSEKFSVRELARRLDLTVPTIHHYFENRVGLLNAIVDVYYREIEIAAKETFAEIASDVSLSDAIARAVRKGFRHARQNRKFVEWLTLDTVKNGHLAPHRHDETQLPFLRVGAMILAKRVGISETEFRLRIRTMIIIIARYAIIDSGELEDISGLPEPIHRVEEHLVSVAKTLLTPS